MDSYDDYQVIQESIDYIRSHFHHVPKTNPFVKQFNTTPATQFYRQKALCKKLISMIRDIVEDIHLENSREDDFENEDMQDGNELMEELREICGTQSGGQRSSLRHKRSRLRHKHSSLWCRRKKQGSIKETRKHKRKY